MTKQGRAYATTDNFLHSAFTTTIPSLSTHQLIQDEKTFSYPPPPYQHNSVHMINASTNPLLNPVYSHFMVSFAASNTDLGYFNLPIPFQLALNPAAQQLFLHRYFFDHCIQCNMYYKLAQTKQSGFPGATLPNPVQLDHLFNWPKSDNIKIEFSTPNGVVNTGNDNYGKSSNNKPVISPRKSTRTLRTDIPQHEDNDNITVQNLKDETSFKNEGQSVGPKNKKVFTCETCHRCFGHKHVLENHKRTHTGEKPFQCSVCMRKFARGHHVKVHMRLHTGERPFTCSYCGRTFVQVSNLRRHENVHTRVNSSSNLSHKDTSKK